MTANSSTVNTNTVSRFSGAGVVDEFANYMWWIVAIIAAIVVLLLYLHMRK